MIMHTASMRSIMTGNNNIVESYEDLLRILQLLEPPGDRGLHGVWKSLLPSTHR